MFKGQCLKLFTIYLGRLQYFMVKHLKFLLSSKNFWKFPNLTKREKHFLEEKRARNLEKSHCHFTNYPIFYPFPVFKTHLQQVFLQFLVSNFFKLVWKCHSSTNKLFNRRIDEARYEKNKEDAHQRVFLPGAAASNKQSWLRTRPALLNADAKELQ